MTVEQQVDALATSVDELKATVVTKKATLDATVVDAQSATAQAQAAKATALSARDQAGAFKDAAYTAAQSAASAVAYQDLTALAAEKAVTAVDVFIYDTSKDSDGGAWRHRCAGTSWFNEPLNTATRGARREFPAVAVIVADLNNLTIYDGDDPALPMWMVFERTTIACWLDSAQTLSSVTALNGIVALGSSYDEANRGGLRVFNFVADFGEHFVALSQFYTGKYAGGIAQRQTTGRSYSGNGKLIADEVVNDVAMTVLPDAPIDPATGLAIPTIAVMTGGGISVIRHDGSVLSATSSTYVGARLGFDDLGGLYWSRGADGTVFYAPNPTVSLATFNFGVQNNALGAAGAGLPRTVDGTIAYGTSRGLSRVKANLAASASAMVAYAASNYATGWLPGAIRGAFLSSNETSSLPTSTELVTNGSFDTDLSGWAEQGPAVTATWNNGTAEVVVSGANEWFYQEIQTEIGATYRVTVDFTKDGAGRFMVGNAIGNSAYAGVVNSGSYDLMFTAASTSTFISLGEPAATGATQIFDNISVKRVEADRSVNMRGLLVNGTITRAPVAAGAELVAYSGFSGANFLEQPFNSGLNFGAGDFCIMGWANPAGDNQAIISYENDTAGAGWTIGRSTGLLRLFTGRGGANKAYSFGALNPGAWQFFCIYRKAGHWFGGVNGDIALTGIIGANDIFVTDSVLRVGKQTLISGAAWAGSIAMIRVSATIPTADQIRRIYEDEKALFQENAACTLYGASDAVTALAHDPDTGLLHVGTSAGRSVFKGLRRVANTTVPVGAAIAAAGGMVVEE